MLNAALNFIYPVKCGVCNKISKSELCDECEQKLLKSLECKIVNYISDKSKYFDNHIYLFKYIGIIKEKIIQYKFYNASYLYKFFSEIIYKNEKICRFLKSYDIIVPVPIHNKRKLKRGYNQSELIAKYIGKILNIPVETKALVKIRNNEQQSQLNKLQRQNNVRNVYKSINVKDIEQKKIILLDDIYTTGNTVNECSRILKLAGAKEISVLTIAKD